MVQRKKIAVIMFFLSVLAVYMGTLFSLYPNLPVIARMAEEIPGYSDVYPPFRLDEYSYYTISRNILSGDVYLEGSLERGFPSGYALVSAPFVAVFGQLGGYIANTLMVWLCLILFYLLARRYAGTAKSLVLTAILAFATLNWFYAVSAYTEPLSQLLVLGAFLILVKSIKDSPFLAFSGAITALNLFVRPHYILLVLPFFIYLLDFKGKKPKLGRGALFFLAGAAGVGIAWMVRNVFIFDGPFFFEYSRLYNSFIPGQQSAYLKGNVFLGMHRLLFDEYKGLFTITPIFLLFFPGLRRMWLEGQKRESLVLLTSVLLMILFAASSPYPFTEFGLGSRHMVPIIPLLIFPLVFFLDRGIFARTVVGIVAVYSFYHAGIGWFTGGEPGKGFFLGILNDSHARAIILSRKGLLPPPDFSSPQELIDSYARSFRDSDMNTFLRTLDNTSLTAIRGSERNVFRYLRSQRNPQEFVISAEPKNGIVLAIERKEE